MAIFPSTSIPSAAGDGYSIDNSCRFDDGSTPTMTRTPSSTGSRTTFTLSVWVKLCSGTQASSYYGQFFAARTTNSGYYGLMQMLDVSGLRFHFGDNTGASCRTLNKYRDCSAWYHVVYKIDSTENTNTDRVKIYVNGELATLDSPTYPTLNENFNFNNSVVHHVGKVSTSGGSTDYFDGYMAEMHFVDGTALDADSFGEFDETYGHWKAKEVDVTYGTNGFYLDFADSSALGNDVSGNNNDYATTNLTASDQMTDTPTNSFCTMNPLDNYYAGSTFSEGNLGLFITTSAQPTNTATFGMTSGKWYWEVRQGLSGAGGGGVSYYGYLGIAGSLGDASSSQLGEHIDQYSLYANSAQQIRNNNSWNSYGTTISYTNGDVISMALDLDNNKMYWAKNGTWLNSGDPAGDSNGYSIMAASATELGAYFPGAGDGHSSSENYIFNFGQDGTFAGNETAGNNADDNEYGNFLYDVPAGFLALCTKNLPDPTVTPSEHFNTILYDDGAGAKTGVGFQPDLVWVKSRGSTYSHKLTDAVRGVTKAILKPNSAVEATDSTGLTAFGTDGFTVGADTTYSDTTGDGMVAWNWKANGSGSSNGTGSVTSTVSANTSAGFSIVSWVGTGATATIGHGLSQTPNFITVKNREGTHNQIAGTIQSNIVDFTDGIFPDWIDAMNDNADYFSDTPPTSSVFTVGSSVNLNQSTDNMIAYCWHSVEGYSKIGSYEGNSNADGTFVYTGFKPALVMIKNLDGAGNHWVVIF